MLAGTQPQYAPHRKPLPQPQYLSTPLPHSHSRQQSGSSGVFPFTTSQAPMLNMPQNYTSRRSPSTNTFSTTASSGNGPVPVRSYNPGSRDSTEIRRSTSSRSGGSQQPAGYVALMRRQKATVWCDRAQHEDPRLLAAQKQAKMRAAMEVTGKSSAAGRMSSSGNSTSGNLAGRGGVTAKIRHHGKAGLVGYSPGDLVGGVGGVPMRLSASEVEGGDSDDDADSFGAGLYHHRSGSGRSSLGSRGRGVSYIRQSGASTASGRWSQGHTPPNERNSMIDSPRERKASVQSSTSLAEMETPVPSSAQRNRDYFGTEGGNDGTQTAGSSSSQEKDAVAELNGSAAAKLAAAKLRKSTVTREKSVKDPVELRRRGSVDERTATMTLSAGRLYIANPDNDSD